MIISEFEQALQKLLNEFNCCLFARIGKGGKPLISAQSLGETGTPWVDYTRIYPDAAVKFPEHPTLVTVPVATKRQRPVYQEDDALIHGRDPYYRGIHEWWEQRFPGRVFRNDWQAAEGTEVDGGDCWTRTIEIPGEDAANSGNVGPCLLRDLKLRLTVTCGVDGYSVDTAEIVANIA